MRSDSLVSISRGYLLIGDAGNLSGMRPVLAPSLVACDRPGAGLARGSLSSCALVPAALAGAGRRGRLWVYQATITAEPGAQLQCLAMARLRPPGAAIRRAVSRSRQVNAGLGTLDGLSSDSTGPVTTISNCILTDDHRTPTRTPSSSSGSSPAATPLTCGVQPQLIIAYGASPYLLGSRTASSAVKRSHPQGHQAIRWTSRCTVPTPSTSLSCRL